MPQVSRRFMNKKTQDRIVSLFISCWVKCSNKDITNSFIDDLLTPTESIMLAKRFSIAYLLLEGYDYRTISRILKVSTTTIGLVSLMLREKGNGLRYVISKIRKDEEFAKLLDGIKDAAEDFITSQRGQNWSVSKKSLWLSRKDRQKPF